MVIDNMDVAPDIIAKGPEKGEIIVINPELWTIVLQQSKSHGK
jgi:hypothetical protein